MTNIQADLFQFLSHTRPAIAAKAETGLFFDVGQRDHIRPLSATGWAVTERPSAARADIHDMAHPSNGKCRLVFFDEPKPHGFWLAKNTVAFFRISLSSLRIRFSSRSRLFS